MNQAGDAPIAGAPRRWDFLAGVMNELNLKSFVEVGCKEGKVSGHILTNVPGSTVVAIDPWTTVEKGSDPKRETYEDWNFEQIEKEFWENIGENKPRCRMLRMTSLDAAEWMKTDRDYPPGSMHMADIVFIDALHDYESVKADIEAWFPKVRPGGVISGGSFNHKWVGVERAVADSFDLMTVGLGTDSIWFLVKPSG